VLNLEVFFQPDQSMSEVAAAIDRVERRIQAAHPEVRYIFLGAEALSRSTRTGSAPSGSAEVPRGVPLPDGARPEDGAPIHSARHAVPPFDGPGGTRAGHA
jgi:hypothetical protein